MTIILILILVMVVILLVVYNVMLNQKLKTFKTINQKITSLNVLQEFMSTIGGYATTDEKIKKINQILIEKYNIKYSTIVTFDGTKFVIRASNVDEKHWDALSKLHEQEIFKDSINKATPKYITVKNETERLPYQDTEFGRARSALFFPLYIENIFVGYWLLESSEINAFQDIDTTILEVVKDNIISICNTITYQKIIESIPRLDKATNLYSAEYLYANARSQIDSHTESAICMFKIANLSMINESYNRATGTKILQKVVESIKSSLAKEYIMVRYMGPKFIIVFSGIDLDGATEFIKNTKEEIEALSIPVIEEYEGENYNGEEVSPSLNFVLTTYYKGTALENVVKQLEEYIDNAPEEESDINHI